MKKHTALFLSVVLVMALMVGALGIRGTAAQGQNVMVWTKFNDQNPQNAQDNWLAAMLAEYKQTGSTATNTFQPYDQINNKLNAAVLAKGEVPDVSYVDTQYLNFFLQNGTLTDLTEWVKAAPWFSDLDPKALAACTTPDGKIMCVPAHTAILFTYYWKGLSPEPPKTTDDLLTLGAKLKAANQYAFTGKLSESTSVERMYYNLILTFGGTIADENGLATWANEGTVKAVEWLRVLFGEGYAARESLAPGFDSEQPFMRGESATFLAGSWSYVYLTPLTSPKGTVYEGTPGDVDPKTAGAVGKALSGGELGLAPPISAPGGKPNSFLAASAWGIPNGAKNIEGAKDFINFQMETTRNAAYSIAYGALPAMLTAKEAPEFQTDYWKTVSQYQTEYGVNSPTFLDYNLGLTLLSDAIVKLITDPSLDIMATLQAAQDEYNASVE